MNEAVEAEPMMRWSAAACPFAIDLAAAVLSSVRGRAKEAFLSVPYGGVEVGGVLFGRVHPNARSPLRIEVVEERRIECAYTRGPSFLLSAEEEAKLTEKIGAAGRDPELAGLSVVGFWVSHTRSELELLAADREIYGKFFPNPWQVVLVLRPANGELTRGGFFFRDCGVVSAHTAREFYAEGGLPVEAAAEVPAEAAEEVLELREVLPLAISNPYSILQAPVEVSETGDSGLGWGWIVLLMLTCLVAGAAAAVWSRGWWLPLLR